MSPLSHRPPRPRASAALPAYPRAVVVGAFVAGLTCSCNSPPAPQTPTDDATVTAVVTAEAPKEPLVIAGNEGPEPIAVDGIHFPEDDAPLDENLGCRGDCPAPYVMAINRKDRSQIEARIRYCDKGATEQGERNDGSVSIVADIDATGHAQDVAVTPTGEVGEVLVSCLQKLVRTAPFTSDRAHARRAGASAPVGKR